MPNFVTEIYKSNSHLHVYSGALLIAVDNALWGANLVTLGLSTPLVSLIAFLLVGIGVFLVQYFMEEDSTGVAIAKGFVVGVMAGVPTSIVGSLGGIYILGKAGIRALRGQR